MCSADVPTSGPAVILVLVWLEDHRLTVEVKVGHVVPAEFAADLAVWLRAVYGTSQKNCGDKQTACRPVGANGLKRLAIAQKNFKEPR
jgi:hypothetical protein